jgi:hypothetical protein
MLEGKRKEKTLQKHTESLEMSLQGHVRSKKTKCYKRLKKGKKEADKRR